MNMNKRAFMATQPIEYDPNDDPRIMQIYDRVKLSDIWRDEHAGKKCPFCLSNRFLRSERNYLCADCESHGDQVSYIMQCKGKSLEEAVKLLWNRVKGHE